MLVFGEVDPRVFLDEILTSIGGPIRNLLLLNINSDNCDMLHLYTLRPGTEYFRKMLCLFYSFMIKISWNPLIRYYIRRLYEHYNYKHYNYNDKYYKPFSVP